MSRETEIEPNETEQPRFTTQSMKALQIIQTIMLVVVIGIGGWIGTTTVDSARTIAKMEETIRGMTSENARFSQQLQRLSDEHYALDRRVTTIEARTKP